MVTFPIKDNGFLWSVSNLVFFSFIDLDFIVKIAVNSKAKRVEILTLGYLPEYLILIENGVRYSNACKLYLTLTRAVILSALLIPFLPTYQPTRAKESIGEVFLQKFMALSIHGSNVKYFQPFSIYTLWPSNSSSIAEISKIADFLKYLHQTWILTLGFPFGLCWSATPYREQ